MLPTQSNIVQTAGETNWKKYWETIFSAVDDVLITKKQCAWIRLSALYIYFLITLPQRHWFLI